MNDQRFGRKGESLRTLGFRRPNSLRRNHALPLEHRIELIGGKVSQSLHLARWPADLQAVDLGCSAQPGVDAQIVLREIAATAVDLIGLGNAAGNDLEPGVERQPVALRTAGQLEADPVPPRHPMVPEKRWRPIAVADYDIHI